MLGMDYYGGIHLILTRVRRIGWCGFVDIVRLLIILWIAWMGNKRGGRGVVRRWVNCCEFHFLFMCYPCFRGGNVTQQNIFYAKTTSDHGFDCICTLFHIATCSSYFNNGGTYWYIAVQTSLQLAFFMAQWVSDTNLLFQHNFVLVC